MPQQKPDQIAEIDFNKEEIITEAAFAKELKKEEVLNFPNVINAINRVFKRNISYICYYKDDYLNLATWMKSVENYILSAEDYFLKVEESYNDIMAE